jgi:hypothetical protein
MMTKHPQIESLFQEYVTHTDSKLEFRFFSTLITYFPGLLIIAADGIVDEEEWYHVEQLVSFMTKTFENEIADEDEQETLAKEFLANMQVLVDSLKMWEEKFLDALGILFEEMDEDDAEDTKELVYEIMEMFAESSEGISDEEQDKIDAISERLNLLDED